MKFKLLFALFAILSLSIVACGDDDIDCMDEAALEAEISDEIQAVTNATFAYIDDPSDDNCNDLRDALQDYIDAARDLEDCAEEVGELEDFQESLDEAQAELDSLEC